MGCFKKVHVTGATHVVSCLIASHAELLKLFNLFPFRPRSRAVRRRRKPAQVQHSLHQVCIVDRGVLGALVDYSRYFSTHLFTGPPALGPFSLALAVRPGTTTKGGFMVVRNTSTSRP